jgi:large subunit ribosomal protein L2
MFNKYGTIFKIVKDSKRTTLLGLVKYSNGIFNYVLLPHGIKYGSFILNKTSIFIKFLTIKTGSTTYLLYFNVLTVIFNVNFNNKIKGQYARAAGTFCQILEINKTKNLILIEFPTKLKK